MVVAGHLTLGSRERTGDTQLAFFSLVSTIHWMVLPTFRVGLSYSSYIYRNTLKCLYDDYKPKSIAKEVTIHTSGNRAGKMPRV